MPVELFGQTRFPPIGDAALPADARARTRSTGSRSRRPRAPSRPDARGRAAAHRVAAARATRSRGRARDRRSSALLLGFVPARRWFARQGAHDPRRRDRRLRAARGRPPSTGAARAGAREVEYREGERRDLLRAARRGRGRARETGRVDAPQSDRRRARARAATAPCSRTALIDARAAAAFLDVIRGGGARASSRREPRGRPTRGACAVAPAAGSRRVPPVFRAEQSNTSVVFGRALIMKLFRRVEEGVNPEVELGTFLSTSAGFANSPAVRASLEYRGGRRSSRRRSRVLHELRAQRGRRVGVHARRPRVASTSRSSPSACTATSPRAGGQPGASIGGAGADPRRRARALVGDYLEAAAAARPARGRAARRARRRHDGPGVRAGALHAAAPALGLPVDAQPRACATCGCSARRAAALPDGASAPRRRARCSSASDASLARFARLLGAGRSTRSASAATATCTSARCSSPARTS